MWSNMFCYTTSSMQRFIFVGVISVSLFTLSLLSARIYALGFRTGPTGTRIATLIGIFLPLFLLLSMTLTRASTNVVLRFIGAIGDILTGIGFYLLLASLVLGIILVIGTLFSVGIPVWLSYLFFFLGILLSGIGFLQATYITTRIYEVPLQNAPVSWNGKRAVLVSDTHFGQVNAGGFAKKVVSHIEKLHPDFVLFAGDMYDGPAMDTLPISTAWSNLTQTTPVFYAPGNHEGYGPYETFLASAHTAGFTVLDNKKTMYDGVEIAGLTYHTKTQTGVVDSILKSFAFNKNIPIIMVNHPPLFTDLMEANGVDLMVSGHTHNGQFWPFGYLTKAIYGKFNYGFAQNGDLGVITTRGVGTFGPPMRLFNSPELVEITFKVN